MGHPQNPPKGAPTPPTKNWQVKQVDDAGNGRVAVKKQKESQRETDGKRKAHPARAPGVVQWPV